VAVTRELLDGVLARLDADVFRDLEEADEAEPPLTGIKELFVSFTRTTDENAFEGTRLIRALPMRWGGRRSELQLAFCRLGLAVRIEESAPPRGDSVACGALVVDPSSDERTSDLARVLSAFDALESAGVIALPLAGFTDSDAWTDVAEGANVRGFAPEAITAVFWHEQCHEAFDAMADLRFPLALGWRGDLDLIVEALEREGLTVVRPTSVDEKIEVRSAASAAPFVTFEAARVAIAKAALAKVSPRAREATKKAAEEQVVARFRSPERKAGGHLAFGRGVLAVAERSWWGRARARPCMSWTLRAVRYVGAFRPRTATSTLVVCGFCQTVGSSSPFGTSSPATGSPWARSGGGSESSRGNPPATWRERWL